ncbi:hypothetical protein Lalb_Chr13g0301601 [Lupinus albus]|uniref:Uncharacterized protein n=1 Tax=Lupinus albus TaxID=3870 RepID=A0A6A4PK22_LUPAL|nr:hypothetical protein Lalb_Chr13g0301601 [Lupinus albus]
MLIGTMHDSPCLMDLTGTNWKEQIELQIVDNGPQNSDYILSLSLVLMSFQQLTQALSLLIGDP